MTQTSRRMSGLAAGAALAAALLPAPALAATKSTAYYGVGNGSSNAYLIDWQGKTAARVTAAQGVRSGTVSASGGHRLITLAPPLSVSQESLDECGELIQLRTDTHQVLVRELPAAAAEVVEIGQTVNVGGCQDGLTVPFGSETDPGLSLVRVGMGARPSVTDLVPGSRIAGFSEDVATPEAAGLAEDVVTLQAGSAQFQATGHVVPAAFDASGWLVFDLPGFQRAYTRVAVHAQTGGETWLLADWAGGPLNVQRRLVVKPAAGAGFGSLAQASRIWESGLFTATPRPFFFHLYKNGTGERVQKDLDLGTEFRTPITAWGFDGLNLLQTRPLGGGLGHRTWVPLRNQGKFRWVLESEVAALSGQEPFLFVKPRVNVYEDTGKAVPPPADAARAPGMVYLNAKPALPR